MKMKYPIDWEEMVNSHPYRRELAKNTIIWQLQKINSLCKLFKISKKEINELVKQLIK